MKLKLNLDSVDDYRTFLKIKSLPRFEIHGRVMEFPDEYAGFIGMKARTRKVGSFAIHQQAFDYQRDITALAIRKRKYALFVECGMGKTLMILDFARNAVNHIGRRECVLIVSPLMVINQTINEAKRFYDDLDIERVPAARLNDWLKSGSRIGITNYEAITDEVQRGRLGCLILDESSMLKSHYGKWGTRLIELGRGLDWKLCATGTPAPNDRIEYANHAVFLDQFPTVNSFLARFFVNRGQTGERWELKPHALKPFYRALSHWCIFLSDPSVYGWKDNAGGTPPINVHYHPVELTSEQTSAATDESNTLFPVVTGGFVNRGRMAQIAKGNIRGEKIATNKPTMICDMVQSWDESTIVWCKYNAEQDELAAMLPDAGSISGSTPEEKRIEIIERFQRGELKTIITKPKILGFGLNLQICTRMIFSTLQDSYEEYYQAVKRANRYGSTKPLNVHIPLSDLERPMVENVMRKAAVIDHDTREQESLFKEVGYDFR